MVKKMVQILENSFSLTVQSPGILSHCIFYFSRSVFCGISDTLLILP